jgi:hypothetical protein
MLGPRCNPPRPAPLIVDGPTPAIAWAFIQTEEGWRFWGRPDSEDLRAAKTVPLPVGLDVPVM